MKKKTQLFAHECRHWIRSSFRCEHTQFSKQINEKRNYNHPHPLLCLPGTTGTVCLPAHIPQARSNLTFNMDSFDMQMKYKNAKINEKSPTVDTHVDTAGDFTQAFHIRICNIFAESLQRVCG